MLSKFFLLALVFFLSVGKTWASCFDDSGFFPNSSAISIPTSYHNLFNLDAVTEEEFNRVSDEVQKLYQPIFHERGEVLEVVKKWKSNTVNAYAKKSMIKKTSRVYMFGGLARHPLITTDGYTLVLCHEIGHHLGGLPLARAWASNEGQADYFGTSKCLRKYFSTQDSAAIVANMTIPAKVQSQCFSSFGPSRDHALCVRGSMAGFSLANVLNALSSGGSRSWGGAAGTDSAKPDFETPDTSVVTQTFSAHPQAQCRLDTYFAGAICEVPSTVDFSYKDEATGACTSGISARPACWFAKAQ